MRIVFTDDYGGALVAVLASAKDHWDACLIGHEILLRGKIPGAVDFIVEPLNGSTSVHVDVIEEASMIEAIA